MKQNNIYKTSVRYYQTSNRCRLSGRTDKGFLKVILDYFLSHDKIGLMTVYKNENLWDRSNIIYSDGKILKYDKRDISPEMKYIDYGPGILRKEAFKNITENEVLDLADLYKQLINREEMPGHEVKERFYEIGSSEGLEETEKYLKKLNLNDKGRFDHESIKFK
ncbi:MAG: hypothetical protein ABRQ39_17265 [Candidatus Eremiobacterota bacterium]